MKMRPQSSAQAKAGHLVVSARHPTTIAD